MFIATILLLSIRVVRKALANTLSRRLLVCFTGTPCCYVCPPQMGSRLSGSQLWQTPLSADGAELTAWPEFTRSFLMSEDWSVGGRWHVHTRPFFRNPRRWHFSCRPILFHAWRCNKSFRSRCFQSPESSLFQLIRFPSQMWIVLSVRHCDAHEVIKIHYDTVSQRPASAASYTACRWPCRLRWEATRHHRAAASCSHSESISLSSPLNLLLHLFSSSVTPEYPTLVWQAGPFTPSVFALSDAVFIQVLHSKRNRESRHVVKPQTVFACLDPSFGGTIVFFQTNNSFFSTSSALLARNYGWQKTQSRGI